MFSEKTEQQKDALVNDILLIQGIFNKWGYFAYPVFGTLLGIVREGDFIAHDVDIDMCWHAKGTNKKDVALETLTMFHKTKKKGILAYPHNYVGTIKAQVTPEIREGGQTFIDLNVSWTEKDYWINIFGNYGQLDVTPREATLRGKTVLIPQDAEKFLKHTYGDWKTPKQKQKDFDYTNDPIRSSHIQWASYLCK